MKHIAGLFLVSVAVFSLMSYWGIRAPDCEIVFRSTESLANRGDFSVQNQLSWKGFGIAKGVDGRNYSIFGPGQSVAAVGLYKIAELVNESGWYEAHPRLIGKSHYFGNGAAAFVNEVAAEDPDEHAARSFMGWFNILIGACCVVAFYLIIRMLTASDEGALLSSILFGFGTMILPYTGTFFSELLATLFVMLSFLLLLGQPGENEKAGYTRLLISGVMLGLAILTHITAILFLPFFLLIVLFGSLKLRSFEVKKGVLRGVFYMVGIAVCLVLLGYFNFDRFGNWLETGRSAEGAFRYGKWIAPWHGMNGMLFSAGKGLFFYSPAVILGICFWRRFFERHKLISLSVMMACIFRLVFISMRSDWSGGLCLGPRYLVMIIPFLLIPVGIAFGELLALGKKKSIALLGIGSLLCISQQIYFSVGEVFSYWRCNAMLDGVNLFNKGLIYETWEVSPLFFLMSGMRGPLLFQNFPYGNLTLLGGLCAISALTLFWLYLNILRHPKTGR